MSWLDNEDKLTCNSLKKEPTLLIVKPTKLSASSLLSFKAISKFNSQFFGFLSLSFVRVGGFFIN